MFVMAFFLNLLLAIAGYSISRHARKNGRKVWEALWLVFTGVATGGMIQCIAFIVTG